MIQITFRRLNDEQWSDGAELNMSHEDLTRMLATKEIPLEVNQRLSSDEIKWLEMYLPEFGTEYICEVVPDFPT
jgi:hypothetical protein